MAKDDDDKPTFKVTSYNQVGGITAGHVNFGPQPRALNDSSRSQLRQIRSERPEAPITVDAVLGNAEAFQYAVQVKAFFEAEGDTVNGVNQVVPDSPIMGQEVNKELDRFYIIIGTRP